MTRVIAYAYEAGVHCPCCAYRRFGPHPHVSVPLPGLTDERGIPYDAVDSEGNPVHPIFSTDEQLDPLHCGDCLE